MKVLLLMIAAYCLSFSSYAQFRVGINYGIHVSGLNPEDGRKSKPLFSPHIGFTCEIPLRKSRYVFQADILYYQLGYTNSNLLSTAFPAKTIEAHRLNYIQVPIHFLYRAKARKGMFKVGAGPFIAFNITDRTKINGMLYKEEILPAGVESITPVLIGAGIQLGYEWRDCFISLGMQSGLNDVYRNSQPSLYDKWKVYNGGISFGFLIPKTSPKKKNPRKRSGIFPS